MIKRLGIVIMIICAIVFIPYLVGWVANAVYFHKLDEYWQANTNMEKWACGLVLLIFIIGSILTLWRVVLYIIDD